MYWSHSAVSQFYVPLTNAYMAAVFSNQLLIDSVTSLLTIYSPISSDKVVLELHSTSVHTKQCNGINIMYSCISIALRRASAHCVIMQICSLW